MRELGSLEAETMEHMWSLARPVLVHDVIAAANAGRTQPLAYTTVMTVMNKLVRKGLLTRRREGRAFLYEPVETREDHTARVMTETLGVGGDRTTALMRFAERLTPEDAAALRAVLDKNL